MALTLKVTSAPSIEPLTRDQVKLHLGLMGFYDYDDRIDQLISATRKKAEKVTNRRLITQTLEYYLDRFPCDDEIKLPVAPVSAVNSVKYYDSNDVQQTLSTDYYTSDLITEPGRICLNWGYVWPTTRYEKPNAITINFDAGYGTAATDVDEGILSAMLVMIEIVFDRPDSQYQQALERIARRELSPYMLKRF